MKKAKSLLAILLVACVAFGTLQMALAKPASRNYMTVTEDMPTSSQLSGGVIYVYGQDSVVTYNAITGGLSVDLYYDIYADPSTYMYFNSSNLLFNYDDTILEFSGSFGYDNINADANNDDGAGTLRIQAVVDETSVGLPATGYAGGFVITFNIKDADAFRAIDPSVGLTFAVDTDRELTAVPRSGGDGSPTYATWVNGTALAVSKAATLTYTHSTLSYNANGGTGSALPVAEAFGIGETVTIPTGIVLNKTISDQNHMLGSWDLMVDGTLAGNYKPGDSFIMPSDNATLVAQFTLDQDDDGVPDEGEYAVTYELRTGDEATLDFSATTQHGDFYDVTTASGTIGVTKGEAIGDAAPAISVAGVWKVVGYFVGDTKIADIAAYVPAADVTIQIRTIPDENNNDIDDRTNVEIEFYDDGELVGSITVPDGMNWVVYEDDAGTEDSSGSADDNPTVIDLTGIEKPTNSDGSPFSDWTIAETVDGQGDPVVVAVPNYSPKITVNIPEDDEGNTTPVEVEKDSWVIFFGIDGNEITRVQMTTEGQTVTAPAVGSVSNLPGKDADGNLFDSWIMTGPVLDSSSGTTVVYYHMNPEYKDPWQVTVTDDDDNVIFDDEVPEGTEIIVLDEEGNPITEITVTDDEDIKLPAVTDEPTGSELPVKNDDGELFKEWDIEEEDTDNDGIPDIITVVPVYELPDAGDVDVIEDPDDDEYDYFDISGEGVTILRGAWANNENVATMNFYLRVADAPADAKDLSNLAFTADVVYGFELFKDIYNFGTLGTPKYEGKATINGDEYGKFSVTYTSVKSGVVRVAATYTAKDDVTKLASHIVVTVADVTKDGRVSATDYAAILRVVNDKEPVPTIGSLGGYAYELMNTDKDSVISASDYGIVLRMVNSVYPAN